MQALSSTRSGFLHGLGTCVLLSGWDLVRIEVWWALPSVAVA